MKLFDSGPIIAILGNLDSPEILKQFIKVGYHLYAPNKVVEEVTHHPEKKNLDEMLKSNQITHLAPFNDQELQKFRSRFYNLGKGECELILWAQEWLKENKKFCCIIDDKNARKTAEKFGLKCTGTVGLLIKLKIKGIISEDVFKNHMATLQMHGFRYKFK